jgi:Raf kinase inhibitor-like YbhB/YbcL family protein
MLAAAALVFALQSAAFSDHDALPKRFTCEGADVSPPLEWSGAPPGTKSFALIVDDPDAPDPAAPKRVWVHWVVYDVPARVTELTEGAKSLASPARAAKSDFGETRWRGPCPPIGRHRYFFKLYALDVETLPGEVGSKAELEAAMKGHVLGQAELVGLYQKSR